MKYLNKSFSVAMPGRSPMACERCVWGRGRHAIFCESELPSARLDVIDAIVDQIEGVLPCGHPRSSLYFGKYALEEGECMDCGEEYTRKIREEV